MPSNDSVAARLSDANRRIYRALFRHPSARDLEWRDVRVLIEALAEVQHGRKGLFKATRHGVMTTFRAPRDRAPLSEEELVEVRSFVERSSAGVSTPVVAEGTRLLVVIDVSGARIHRIVMRASEPRGLEPFHANGYPAHLRSCGKEGTREPQPVGMSFYTTVGRALRGAEEILLLACGDGGASAMQALRAELERHHAMVSRQIVGARVLKSPDPGEQSLLDEARSFYAVFLPGRAKRLREG